MSEEILDDDDSDFTTEENEPVFESQPASKAQPEARRRIEELMEQRRLKALLDDPYQEAFEDQASK
jgi:hypothetical protein